MIHVGGTNIRCILGVIKRERKLINNGLKGKTNLCSWLFIEYNVGGPVLVLEKTVSFSFS